MKGRIAKLKRSKGKIKNATALTLDNGLKFRSRLELFAYNKLKENNINNFKYEEDKFILLEPFEFNNESIEAYELSDRETGVKTKVFQPITNKIRSITYLPDFTCIDENKTGWIIECKGYNNDAFPNKWKYFKKYLIDNGYNVTLYKPNTQKNVLKCIEMIKEKYYDKKVSTVM